jgi:hypothetical protein
LKHNNPIKLALKEIEALFLNDPSAKRPTLKVSLVLQSHAIERPEDAMKARGLIGRNLG